MMPYFEITKKQVDHHYWYSRRRGVRGELSPHPPHPHPGRVVDFFSGTQNSFTLTTPYNLQFQCSVTPETEDIHHATHAVRLWDVCWLACTVFSQNLAIQSNHIYAALYQLADIACIPSRGWRRQPWEWDCPSQQWRECAGAKVQAAAYRDDQLTPIHGAKRQRNFTLRHPTHDWEMGVGGTHLFSLYGNVPLGLWFAEIPVLTGHAIHVSVSWARYTPWTFRWVLLSRVGYILRVGMSSRNCHPISVGLGRCIPHSVRSNFLNTNNPQIYGLQSIKATSFQCSITECILSKLRIPKLPNRFISCLIVSGSCEEPIRSLVGKPCCTIFNKKDGVYRTRPRRIGCFCRRSKPAVEWENPDVDERR